MGQPAVGHSTVCVLNSSASTSLGLFGLCCCRFLVTCIAIGMSKLQIVQRACSLIYFPLLMIFRTARRWQSRRTDFAPFPVVQHGTQDGRILD